MKPGRGILRRPTLWFNLPGAVLFVLLNACSPAVAQQPTSTPIVSPAVPQIGELMPSPSAIQPSAAHFPTIQPSATIPPASPTPVSPETTPCQLDQCVYPGTLFLQLPIEQPNNNVVDSTYRFGSTQSGMRDPHHGVEFLNPYGTHVWAAGDGVVVAAGTDVDPTSARGVWPITFYGPYSNFYGNLVVIEHELPEIVQKAFPDLGGSIYSLYGHLSEISVQVGQNVQAGQQIGRVGMTGIATGSHLHFEIRIGENSYRASRNPELWLSSRLDASGQPLGALAARFLDPFGNYLEMPSVTIQHLPEGSKGSIDYKVSLITYEEKALIGQPPFLESIGVGSLPAGLYRISFPMGGLRQELVEVHPGQLTVVTFRAD